MHRMKKDNSFDHVKLNDFLFPLEHHHENRTYCLHKPYGVQNEAYFLKIKIEYQRINIE
jgi:hypothetical protein